MSGDTFEERNSRVKVRQGSVVKLVYSDGHEVHWTAAEDVTLSRALDTIGRLARLDPQWDHES